MEKHLEVVITDQNKMKLTVIPKLGKAVFKIPVGTPFEDKVIALYLISEIMTDIDLPSVSIRGKFKITDRCCYIVMQAENKNTRRWCKHYQKELTN